MGRLTTDSGCHRRKGAVVRAVALVVPAARAHIAMKTRPGNRLPARHEKRVVLTGWLAGQSRPMVDPYVGLFGSFRLDLIGVSSPGFREATGLNAAHSPSTPQLFQPASPTRSPGSPVPACQANSSSVQLSFHL